MRHTFLLVILIFVSYGFPVRGAEYESNGELGDTLGLTNLENPKKRNDIPGNRSLGQHISFAWENDLYYQHDYYFTNGFQIDIFHTKLQHSPINRILIPTGTKKEWDRYSGLQLRQEIFTPKDLAYRYHFRRRPSIFIYPDAGPSKCA